jgi:hypothetical protein
MTPAIHFALVPLDELRERAAALLAGTLVLGLSSAIFIVTLTEIILICV